MFGSRYTEVPLYHFRAESWFLLYTRTMSIVWKGLNIEKILFLQWKYGTMIYSHPMTTLVSVTWVWHNFIEAVSASSAVESQYHKSMFSPLNCLMPTGGIFGVSAFWPTTITSQSQCIQHALPSHTGTIRFDLSKMPYSRRQQKLLVFKEEGEKEEDKTFNLMKMDSKSIRGWWKVHYYDKKTSSMKESVRMWRIQVARKKQYVKLMEKWRWHFAPI